MREYIDIQDRETPELRSEEGDRERTREEVLKTIREQKVKRGFRGGGRMRTAAAVVLLLVLLVPASVFGAGKISTYIRENTGQDKSHFNLDIQSEQTVSDAGAAEAGAIKRVEDPEKMRLAFDEVDGYKMWLEDRGWYDFSRKEGTGGRKNFEFSCELIQIDQDLSHGAFVGDVAKTEEFRVNGNRAYYIELNDVVGTMYPSGKDEYGHRVLVFYEEQGYMIQCYAMSGLDRKTLEKYISHVSLKPAKKGKKSTYITLSEYLKYNPLTEDSETEPEMKQESIPLNQVRDIGEDIRFSGISHRVQKVEILDSMESILSDGAETLNDSCGIWTKRLKYSKKDGTLKTYTRETLRMGDGYNEPIAQVTGRREVAQKLVLVTMKVKNTTRRLKEDVPICKDIGYYREQGKKLVPWEESYYRPEIICECQLDATAQYFKETDGGVHFYLKDLEPGEEHVYHIGFFVDEDLVDHAYIFIDWAGGQGQKHSLVKVN